MSQVDVFGPGVGSDPPAAEGDEGSRAEWMTMDQSNKRADLSIPSGLNPAVAKCGYSPTLTKYSTR